MGGVTSNLFFAWVQFRSCVFGCKTNTQGARNMEHRPRECNDKPGLMVSSCTNVSARLRYSSPISFVAGFQVGSTCRSVQRSFFVCMGSQQEWAAKGLTRTLVTTSERVAARCDVCICLCIGCSVGVCACFVRSRAGIYVPSFCRSTCITRSSSIVVSARLLWQVDALRGVRAPRPAGGSGHGVTVSLSIVVPPRLLCGILMH